MKNEPALPTVFTERVLELLDGLSISEAEFILDNAKVKLRSNSVVKRSGSTFTDMDEYQEKLYREKYGSEINSYSDRKDWSVDYGDVIFEEAIAS